MKYVNAALVLFFLNGCGFDIRSAPAECFDYKTSASDATNTYVSLNYHINEPYIWDCCALKRIATGDLTRINSDYPDCAKEQAASGSWVVHCSQYVSPIAYTTAGTCAWNLPYAN